MPMKIYADKRYLPEGLPHCSMLYPFWGFLSKFNVSELSSYVLDHYLETGNSLFELTSIEEADVVVLPFQWEQVVPEIISYRFDLEYHGKEMETMQRRIAGALQLAEELATKAAGNGAKPLAVFFVDDNETLRVPLPNAYTFRPSLRGEGRGPHEFAMPFWVRDEVLASFAGELPLRRKSKKPIVGFCGVPGLLPYGIRAGLKYRLSASPAISRAAAQLEIELLPAHPYRARAQALYLLSRSKDIQDNFIFRVQWFNGIFNDGLNLSVIRETRRQFLDNMLNSDYILCSRGAGNYSIRLYETLCLGRIPVFINTDCVLPFERWIDWKQYCVWIEEKDVPHISKRIMEFHERLSPQQFQDLQRECRRLWLEWLSPQAFFKNFYRHFQ
jgi:hypothetical protein